MPVAFQEIFPLCPPFALFERLQGRPHAFFLDSGQPADGLGAYSFLGFEPFLRFRARGRQITITRDGLTTEHSGDPLAELQALLRRYSAPPASPLPVPESSSSDNHRTPPVLPFTGGAVGYFSYELCTQLENLPRTAPDDLPVPDLEFAFYDGLIAHEHATDRTWLVAHPVHAATAETIFARLGSALQAATAPADTTPELRTASTGETPIPARPSANFTAESYAAAIGRIKDYIRSGDVYQVNLAQRFAAPLTCAPYELYRRLRTRSPAPFAAYLDFGDIQLISSSPERFLRLRGRRIDTRPIKGTRPRSADPARDAQLARELQASVKDRAELLMIVDLERNDLGRVCDYGSVRVDDLWTLESHPTVHHLVANVSGTLRPGLDAIDCLRAAFPGGSITGAPKIRSMEIIDELEPNRRHAYTGAIGYLGFDGNCDLNIAIRTLTCTGGHAYYHVGGGVVWDSDPAAEYQETLDKGRAMYAALTSS